MPWFQRVPMMAFALMAVSAQAQYGSQYLANLGSENFSWYMNSIITRQTASPEAYQRAARARAANPVVALPMPDRAALAIPAPKRLAAGYPQAARPQAEKFFAEMLLRYAQIETQFGIPSGDVGGAVAALVAGSYMGMHNIDFPDAQFKALVAQMRGAISSDEKFAAASPAERRAMYEDMAILGMSLAATQMALKTNRNPAVEANMRSAGRKYLRQLTGMDPEVLKLGAGGLLVG